jgi:hypothetical protein
MTAKEAIRLRCMDCVGDTTTRFTGCIFPDCPLYGLTKPVRGISRTIRLKEYCLWCRNGLQKAACTSKTCGIAIYLAQNAKGSQQDEVETPESDE